MRCYHHFPMKPDRIPSTESASELKSSICVQTHRILMHIYAIGGSALLSERVARMGLMQVLNDPELQALGVMVGLSVGTLVLKARRRLEQRLGLHDTHVGEQQ
jgi:hypothetical protein